MRRPPRVAAFVVAAALWCAAQLIGAAVPAGMPLPQAPAAVPGAHVDVSAIPSVVLAGQPVVISGSTGYSEKQQQAAVLVRHESGAPSASLSAAVQPNGRFDITFADTKKPGKYLVSVTSPDGKGKGGTTFRVDSIASLAGEVEKLATELDTRTKSLVAFVKSTAVSLPASPEREKLVADASKLEERAKAPNLPPLKMLGELKKLVPQPGAGASPDLSPLAELSQWVPEAEQAIDKIDRARIGEKPSPLCETINTAIEGAKFASYAFSITNKLLTTLVKIGTDKGISALVEKLGLEGKAGTASAYEIKVGAEALKGTMQGVSAAVTGLTDWVEYYTKSVFNRYCGSFDGPLGVSMTMVWNEGALPWLKYGVRLDGRLRLRFPKEAPPGKPVYMTGELEGNATSFTFWEDVTVVEQLPRSIMVLERRWLAPIPFKNSTASPLDFGMVARAITPSYFNVPVVAEMTGDTIKMQFKDARVDFTDAVSNRLLFVVMTPLMPDFKVFTFPIQKAHWILSKGFSDPSILTVTASGGVKSIKLTKSKAHRETANKSVVADWVIDVDAKKSGDAQK